MKLTHYFNITRFWLLLRLELVRNYKGILMIFEITFGLLFFLGLLLNVVVANKRIVYDHNVTYAVSMLVGGFIVSSLAFKDLGNTLKRHSFLMLPVSALERFVCMGMLTSVGWVTLYSVIFYLYSIVANTIGSMLFTHVSFQSFNPFGGFALGIMKYYFVLQGIFLVGATHFKGYALPKTLAVLISLALVVFGLFYLILMDVFLMDHVCVVPNECELANQMGMEGPWGIMKVFFQYFLAPLSWGIAFLGLKDQEV